MIAKVTCLFVIIAQFLFSSCVSKDQYVVEYKNGQWFNGQAFESKSLYSVNGLFKEHYTGNPDSILDLKQGYVVPPFGDAHTHNLADPSTIDAQVKKFLKQGIYYVQVLTNYASKADSLRDRFSTSRSIDVQYANGGLTATLGHPHLAYETSALNLHWSAIFSERDRIKNSRIAENDAYWFLDNVEDVEQKWDAILATKPDLIKIYLINTERHDELVAIEQLGKFGLSEEVASAIVSKAHDAGLKVFAHVENAYDFRVGLRIGVDGFGHLPGYSWDGNENVAKYRLTDEDIAHVRERELAIIPTVNFAKVYAMQYDTLGKPSLDTLRYEAVNQFLKDELKRLHQANVKIALGSDQHGETSLLEADYLVNNLQVFNERTTLKFLAETTPQVIFPGRKLGYFKEGFEASFLVLNGNPLQNWDYIDDVNFMVKQGHILNVSKQTNGNQ